MLLLLLISDGAHISVERNIWTRVGVFTGVPATLGVYDGRFRRSEVLDKAIDGAQDFWIATQSPSITVAAKELSIVRKHLFEMWQIPVCCHAVSVEAMAEVVAKS